MTTGRSRRPVDYWPEWRRLGAHNDLTLAEELRRQAERSPQARLTYLSKARPASITLREVQEQALRVAGGLQALGLRRGDRIVAQIPNWAETAILETAAFMLGLVWIPVVHIYEAAELGFILRASRAKMLVTPDRWNGIDYAARVAALGNHPALEHILVIGDGRVPGPAIHWQELLARGRAPEALPRVDPDDLCLIIFTSGTTAAPKGVQHTHQTFGAEMRAATAFLPVRERYRPLAAFPGGHIAGFIESVRARFHGIDAWFLDAWDPEFAADAVIRNGLQASAGTPFHLESLLKAAGDRPLASMKVFLMGSTSIPASAIERADAIGISAYRTYGSSEHPTLTSVLPEEPLARRAGTDGRTLPHNRMRLVDEDENPVRPGEPGEIVCVGPELMKGYLDEKDNESAFAADGWYRTGDIAVMDGEGYIRVVDRKKDIIIRGGEKFSSKEIEDHLMAHPAVLEAAAVGWPDARYGERVAVFVRLRDRRTVGIEEIRAHFGAAGMSLRKTPEKLVLVEDFPRNAAGKIRKNDLRAEAARLAQTE